MKGGTSAPDPDPQIGEAALKQAQTGEEWLNFAKDAFAVSQDRQTELDALTKRVTEQQLGIADQQAAWSAEDRSRYNTTFKPVEDQFIQEATNYASTEKQNEAAAEARADVQTAAANARDATARSNAAMGIDPRSGRAAGVQATTDMNATLAEAGAANTARQSVRDKGLALKADVVNLGRGATASAAQGAAGSVASGATALSGAQATNAQALAAPSVVSQGFSGAMQGYGGQASTLNQQYGIQSNNWQAQQQMAGQSAAGVGSFLGGIAGLFMSDENVKHDIEGRPEGASLEAVEQMPVSDWTYNPGVADEGRHTGPMAQDFKAATGKGDGRTIAVQDAIGITIGAVQDLNAKVDRIAMAVGLGESGKMSGPEAMAKKKPMMEIA